MTKASQVAKKLRNNITNIRKMQNVGYAYASLGTTAIEITYWLNETPGCFFCCFLFCDGVNLSAKSCESKLNVYISQLEHTKTVEKC